MKLESYDTSQSFDAPAQGWFRQQTGRIQKPRPSSHAGLWDKVSRTDSHTHEKTGGFFSQN